MTECLPYVGVHPRIAPERGLQSAATVEFCKGSELFPPFYLVACCGLKSALRPG